MSLSAMSISYCKKVSALFHFMDNKTVLVGFGRIADEYTLFGSFSDLKFKMDGFCFCMSFLFFLCFEFIFLLVSYFI